MKKLFLVILVLVFASFVSANVDYFSSRMNFPTDESRTHVQTLTNNFGSSVVVNATIPSGFTVDSTDCTTVNSTLLSCTIPSSGSRTYTLSSPSSCTDGTVYKSKLRGNLSAEFVFVCIPDNKIADCKVEYGHGDANYLDELYISDETATIFNLVRVWNIGHYLTPNEDAINATIKCQYENYPVRTYGRVEVAHGDDEINGTYLWTRIEGGYWFRIGVLSQEVSGKSVGDTYDVDCNQLEYWFEHTRVIANYSTCDLEVREKEPLFCNATAHPVFTDKIIVTFFNQEKYGIHDMSFDKSLDGLKHTETYQFLDNGDSVSYVMDNSSADNIDVFFIPSWYANSLKPKYYKQNLNCFNASILNIPPVAGPDIPDFAWLINTNKTDAFDLDDHFSDVDNLTYTCDDPDNITVLIDANNSVTFVPDHNWTGNRTIRCYANDSVYNTPSNYFNLLVYDCGNGIIDPGEQCDGANLNNQTCQTLGWTSGTLTCSGICMFDTSGCSNPGPGPGPGPGGGGGGGGGRPRPPVVIPPEVIPPKLDLRITSYPRKFSVKDVGFWVKGEVRNVGGEPLGDIVLDTLGNCSWLNHTVFIGDLDPGQKRTFEIFFENEICSWACFDLLNRTSLFMEAYSGNIKDSELLWFDIDIPKLSVISDRQYYFEGDTMRICIIYNNINDTYKDQLEYEVDVAINRDEYIVDYLSSYEVGAGQILIVTRDNILDKIHRTGTYDILVDLFQQGELFTGLYLVNKTNNTVFINGFIEYKIEGNAGYVYNFKFDNEDHKVLIRKVDENYVDVTVSSEEQKKRVKLVETEEFDLTGNGKDDVSLTYMGDTSGDADVRLRLLPRAPARKIGRTASYIIDLHKRSARLQSAMDIREVSIFKPVLIITLLIIIILIGLHMLKVRQPDVYYKWHDKLTGIKGRKLTNFRKLHDKRKRKVFKQELIKNRIKR